MSGRYPSRKMGVTIGWESHTVELAAIYLMERDRSVLACYEQPLRLRLDHRRADGRRVVVDYTPDFLVFLTDGPEHRAALIRLVGMVLAEQDDQDAPLAAAGHTRSRNVYKLEWIVRNGDGTVPAMQRPSTARGIDTQGRSPSTGAEPGPVAGRSLAAPGPTGRRSGSVLEVGRRSVAAIRTHRAALPVASVVVFLIAWQVLASGMNPILLPTPTAVAAAFVQMMKDGTLGPAFVRAMLVLALGFGLSAIVGIAVGVLMGRSETADRVLTPYVSFFQATPLVGLVPLVVIWFGIGLVAEVAVTFLLAVWSIIINTSEGVRNTPETLLDMARIYHASERSVIRNIALPHAVPYIFAGLRIALAKALIGVIIAEMDVSLKGLGGLIANFGDAFETAALIAALITSSLVGVIGTAALEALRRRIAPWAARTRAPVEA